jgi:PKD repeat protein
MAYYNTTVFDLPASSTVVLSNITDLPNDTYVASSSLYTDNFVILDSVKTPFNVGSTSVAGAIISNVSVNSVYSPFENVTLNVSVQSFPGIECNGYNITIPEFGYTKFINFSGVADYTLMLPTLQPGDYSATILLGNDSETFDSEMVPFTVEASGVGVLDFNNTSMLCQVNDTVNYPMIVTDFNQSFIDANVSLEVTAPNGSRQYYDVYPQESSQGSMPIYYANFTPASEGTYVIQGVASKPGYVFYDDSTYLVTGNMSALNVSITGFNNTYVANITANGVPTACSVVVDDHVTNQTLNMTTSDGIVVFQSSGDFNLTASKMMYQLGYGEYVTPIALFNATLQSNLTVQFDASQSQAPDGSIQAYTWDFGDSTNTTVYQPIVDHTYTSPENYMVTLQITDDKGLSNITIATLNMPIPLSASFTSNVTNSAAPLTVQFNDTSTGSPTSWQWNFGDNSTNSTTENPVYTYNTPGLYNVILTVTNNSGATSSTSQHIDVSSPSPSVSPSPSPSLSPSPNPSPSPVPRSFTLNLNPGWNLVSLPIENSSLWAGNISASNVDKVAYYNGSAQLFSTFLVGLSHTDKNFPIVPDTGYFVNCTNSMSLSMSLTLYGTLVDSPRTLSLYPGWNMIGWSSSSNMTAQGFGGLSGNITKIAGYNSQTELYTTYLVGLSHADRDFNMTSGNGYFVYSNATSIVSVNI